MDPAELDGRHVVDATVDGPTPHVSIDISDRRSTPRRASNASAAAGPLTSRGELVRVRVAARVRPLLPLEALGARQGLNCVDVDSPSVFIGKSCFTFDHVFGPEASQEDVYEECVAPLVEATFDGVNGTLLAYGQTGSGKTYTMGTSGLPSVPQGALPRAIHRIFTTASERAEIGTTNFRVSFAEIFTDSQRRGNVEEIRDLLTPGRAQVFATIKTDLDGQPRLEGVEEHEVWTEQEALALLNLGSASRATASTRMNDSSSRSHAIFSLEVIQHRMVSGVPSTLTARFQFVDLAGSEKIKMSGVEGRSALPGHQHQPWLVCAGQGDKRSDRGPSAYTFPRVEAHSYTAKFAWWQLSHVHGGLRLAQRYQPGRDRFHPYLRCKGQGDQEQASGQSRAIVSQLSSAAGQVRGIGGCKVF